MSYDTNQVGRNKLHYIVSGQDKQHDKNLDQLKTDVSESSSSVRAHANKKTIKSNQWKSFIIEKKSREYKQKKN